MQNATTVDDEDEGAQAPLIPDVDVPSEIRNRSVAVLNNMDGPLIRWTSENNVAAFVPRGAGAS